MKRLLIAFSALLSLAASAEAQTSVFDGQWRLVSAEPDGWSVKRQAPAPLLRTGAIFSDGAAKLPPAMGCDKPKREESWIPSRWLFDGEMTGKTLRAFYARHGLTEGANLNGMTLTCGDREVKLVLAEEGRALLAYEGWVYTLRRRAGESDRAPTDVATYLAQSNAGFDCGRAASTTERLICASPDAMEADAAMAKAYGMLRPTLTPAAAQALQRSQAVFNEDRDVSCGAKGGLPKDATTRRDMESCLAETTTARAGYLEVLAVAVAGPLRIDPHLETTTRRYRRPDSESPQAGGWIAQVARPVLSGASPAVTKAFDDALKAGARIGAPLIRRGEDWEGGRDRSYVVHALTDRFASLLFTTRTEAGTRTAPAIAAVNIDLRTGKAIRLGDILETGQAGFVDAVVKAMKEQAQDPAFFDRNGSDIVLNNAVWAFAQDKALMYWQPDGAAPPEEAAIPAALLAPYLKPGSPWRPHTPANPAGR